MNVCWVNQVMYFGSPYSINTISCFLLIERSVHLGGNTEPWGNRTRRSTAQLRGVVVYSVKFWLNEGESSLKCSQIVSAVGALPVDRQSLSCGLA